MKHEHETVVQLHNALCDSVVFHNKQVYTYLASGTSRHVFVSPDKTHVLKVEKQEVSGLSPNREELTVYELAWEGDRDRMAKTWMEESYIIQEYLRPIETTDHFTMEQITFSLRCRSEVGIDAQGNVKCFDLSEFLKYR